MPINKGSIASRRHRGGRDDSFHSLGYLLTSKEGAGAKRGGVGREPGPPPEPLAPPTPLWVILRK
jgi:hypothetical protein